MTDLPRHVLRLPCPLTSLVTWCGKGPESIPEDTITGKIADVTCEDCRRQMELTYHLLNQVFEPPKPRRLHILENDGVIACDDGDGTGDEGHGVSIDMVPIMRELTHAGGHPVFTVCDTCEDRKKPF